jgi:NTP pyrophosphatase (non-canonical NTP hydrolase)
MLIWLKNASGGLMENKVKRRSLEEIYADMDRVNKRKPTSKQIEELGEVIQKINDGNQESISEEIFY